MSCTNYETNYLEVCTADSLHQLNKRQRSGMPRSPVCIISFRSFTLSDRNLVLVSSKSCT